MRTCIGHDNLVRVCVDNEIGVMRYDDDLALAFGLNEQSDQFVKNGFWVEIFFWLIDDQGTIISS